MTEKIIMTQLGTIAEEEIIVILTELCSVKNEKITVKEFQNKFLKFIPGLG